MNVNKQIVDMSSAYPSNELVPALAASRYLPERKRYAFLKKSKEEIEKRQRIRNMIRKSMCPICGGKLNRGIKIKKNDYKRKWTCTNCKNEYII